MNGNGQHAPPADEVPEEDCPVVAGTVVTPRCCSTRRRTLAQLPEVRAELATCRRLASGLFNISALARIFTRIHA
jgi:hypothetical protein